MLYWLHQVEDYLYNLELNANSVADVLVGLEHATRKADPETIHTECVRLGSLIVELQAKLDQRQTLLASHHNIGRAPTLQSSLNRIEHPLAKDLAHRCERIAKEIQYIHQKSVSIFVGQFHLTSVTEDFLRLMCGESATPVTYDVQDQVIDGSLIDRAA